MKNWKNYALLLAVALLAVALAPKARSVFSSPVTVMNTPSGSVPVWRTDNDGRNVVRLIYSEEMGDGTSTSSKPLTQAIPNAENGAVYTVPAGNRLVVDYVSVLAFPNGGVNLLAFLYNGFTLTQIPIAIHGAFNTQTGSAPIRDYIEPGGQYFVTMNRDSSAGTMFWEVFVVGHLVDCTNGGGC